MGRLMTNPESRCRGSPRAPASPGAHRLPALREAPRGSDKLPSTPALARIGHCGVRGILVLEELVFNCLLCHLPDV